MLTITVTQSRRYELSSVTPNYREYLGHFGMPSIVIPLVVASRETINVKD